MTGLNGHTKHFIRQACKQFAVWDSELNKLLLFASVLLANILTLLIG